MAYRKGTKVYDKCTRRYGTVIEHRTRRKAGRRVTYYLLKGVPVVPALPDGWRWHGEVALKPPKRLYKW